MTEFNHLRGNALRGRSLWVVTEALSRVREAALERALDPKNVAKGPWEDIDPIHLGEMLEDEVRELLWAIEHGEPLPRILSEAGDVAWVVAMVADKAVRDAR